MSKSKIVVPISVVPKPQRVAGRKRRIREVIQRPTMEPSNTKEVDVVLKQLVNPNPRPKKKARGEKLGPEYGAVKSAIDPMLQSMVERSLALPLEYKPVRFSDEYSNALTAIAAPWDRVDVAVNTVTTNQLIPSTQSLIFLFRDPLRFAVYYDPNTTANSVYTWYGQDSTQEFGLMTPSANWGLMTTDALDLPVYLKTPYAQTTDAYQPHGPMIFAGSVKGHPGRFIWVDKGMTLKINYSIDSAAVPTWHLDLYAPGGVQKGYQRAAGVTGAGQQVSFGPFSISGYIAISYKVSAACTLSISGAGITMDGVAPHFCHKALPHFESNFSSAEGVRITSVGLLQSNATNVLNLEGFICAFQVPQAKPWQSFIDSVDTYRHVASEQGSKEFLLKTGCYAFLRPTQPNDFNFRSTYVVEGSSFVDSFYPLDDISSYLVMCSKFADVAAQNFRWTYGAGIEYQTDDTWRDVEQAQVNSLEYSQALGKLRMIPQFYENPLHVSSILGGIKDVANFIANGIDRYGGTIASVVDTISSLAML